MELTEEEKSILYIALCNSCKMYIDTLEAEGFTPDERELVQHLIEYHNLLIDRLSKELGDNQPIPRPTW